MTTAATRTAKPTTAQTNIGADFPTVDLHRAAALILGPHGRAAPLVDRAVTATEHERAGLVSRQVRAYRLTVLACRDRLDGLAPSDLWRHARDAERWWVDPDYVIDVASFTARLQSAGELDCALAGLPDVDRVTVVLRDAIGLTLCECETITRAPTEVLLKRLMRGRRTLLHALSTRPYLGRDTPTGLDAGCAMTRTIAGSPEDAPGDSIRSAVDSHCRTCSRCDSLVSGLTALTQALATHEPTPALHTIPRC